MAAQISEEIAEHGGARAHIGGHVTQGYDDETFASHNQADHEHHLQWLNCSEANSPRPDLESRRRAQKSAFHDPTLGADAAFLNR